MASTCWPLAAPKQQLHRREAPTIFEGNNKSDTTAGSSTTGTGHQNSLQIHMSLEDHNLIDIMENVRCETAPIHDDAPEVPVIPIVEDDPELPAAAQETAAQAAPVDPAAQLEQLTAPHEGLTLEQSHNMIFQSWQCLGQHMFGAQHANVLTEARHIHDKLAENDANLAIDVKTLKDDVVKFFELIEDVKKTAKTVKKNAVERMAEVETRKDQMNDQINSLRSTTSELQEIIQLM
eukprot:3183951-Amphidinium_carterae.2